MPVCTDFENACLYIFFDCCLQRLWDCLFVKIVGLPICTDCKIACLQRLFVQIVNLPVSEDCENRRPVCHGLVLTWHSLPSLTWTNLKYGFPLFVLFWNIDSYADIWTHLFVIIFLQDVKIYCPSTPTHFLSLKSEFLQAFVVNLFYVFDLIKITRWIDKRKLC